MQTSTFAGQQMKRLLPIFMMSGLMLGSFNPVQAGNSSYQAAQKEFISGNYDRTIAIAKNNTDLDSIFLVSRARHLLDSADDGPLSRFLEKNPNNEKALTAMAFTQEEMRHYRDAEQLVQRIFKFSHQNAEAIAVLALCKIRQGNESMGMHILGDALQLGEKDLLVLELAEGGYDCVFDSVTTEKMCDRLIALQPRNPYFWTLKGRFMERAGKQEKAIECYSKAISINPRFDFAYTYRARIYFDRKEHQKVIKDTTGAIDAHMTHGETLNCLALRAGAYAALNKHAEAVADLKEYLELSNAAHRPEFEKQDEALLHMSLSLIALGKFDEAEKVLSQMKKLGRRNSEVLEQEAMIQARLGHKEAALKMYEKLLREEGSNPNWITAIKKLKEK